MPYTRRQSKPIWSHTPEVGSICKQHTQHMQLCVVITTATTPHYINNTPTIPAASLRTHRHQQYDIYRSSINSCTSQNHQNSHRTTNKSDKIYKQRGGEGMPQDAVYIIFQKIWLQATEGSRQKSTISISQIIQYLLILVAQPYQANQREEYKASDASTLRPGSNLGGLEGFIL